MNHEQQTTVQVKKLMTLLARAFREFQRQEDNGMMTFDPQFTIRDPVGLEHVRLGVTNELWQQGVHLASEPPLKMPSGSHGCFDHPTQSIWVDANLAPANQVHILCHEVAHVLTWPVIEQTFKALRGPMKERTQQASAFAEVVAESSAIVLTAPYLRMDNLDSLLYATMYATQVQKPGVFERAVEPVVETVERLRAAIASVKEAKASAGKTDDALAA